MVTLDVKFFPSVTEYPLHWLERAKVVVPRGIEPLFPG